MAVRIAQASISENNTISGKAGNQSGSELNIRNWYNNAKGWRVLMPINPQVGIDIAWAAEAATKNKAIGYNQNERNTLYNNVKDKGFDPTKTTKNVNCDCSSLVRVAVQYAFNKNGIDFTVADFITSNEASKLLASGQFVEMTDSKYTTKSDYLIKGTIIVTKTKG